jgi:hypothetical protein
MLCYENGNPVCDGDIVSIQVKLGLSDESKTSVFVGTVPLESGESRHLGCFTTKQLGLLMKTQSRIEPGDTILFAGNALMIQSIGSDIVFFKVGKVMTSVSYDDAVKLHQDWNDFVEAGKVRRAQEANAVRHEGESQ